VTGLTARSRNVGSQIGASLESIVDWTEISAYGTAVRVSKS
jgi:uncharacterized protein YbjQ (UPF0145 family)